MPIRDRGIDGLVHQRSTGRWTAVQVKGRATLSENEAHFVVWADSLDDDQALLVAAVLSRDHLAPRLLAAPVGEFKRLAERSTNDGRPVYAMGFPPFPERKRGSRWSAYLMAPTQLAACFGADFEPRLAAPPFDPGRQGILGELDLLSRLARRESLDLYRPFPDLEDIDVAVRHLGTHRVHALQVKTLGYQQSNPSGSLGIHAASFRPLPDLHFVVYGWNRDTELFSADALFIPAADIPHLTREHNGQLKFDWQPEGPERTRLGPYAVPVEELAAAVEAALS